MSRSRRDYRAEGVDRLVGVRFRPGGFRTLRRPDPQIDFVNDIIEAIENAP